MPKTMQTAVEKIIIGNTVAPMENLSQRAREETLFFSALFQARSTYFLRHEQELVLSSALLVLKRREELAKNSSIVSLKILYQQHDRRATKPFLE